MDNIKKSYAYLIFWAFALVVLSWSMFGAGHHSASTHWENQFNELKERQEKITKENDAVFRACTNTADKCVKNLKECVKDYREAVTENREISTKLTTRQKQIEKECNRAAELAQKLSEK